MDEKHYRRHGIRKSNGKMRWLNIPSDELKEAQRECLRKEMLTGVGAGPHSFGCVVGRTTWDMARMHAGPDRQFIVRFDLKSAFDNVRPDHLLNALKWEKFSKRELNDRLSTPDWVEKAEFNRFTYPKGMFNLVFLDKKVPGGAPVSFLAQGAPTSPHILNLVLKQADFKSVKALKGFGPSDARYSRYVDDVVLSSNSKQIIPFTKKVIVPIFSGIGFPTNRAKWKIMRTTGRQTVLSILVNNTTTLPKPDRQMVRGKLHRLFSMALKGVDKDGSPVDFSPEGEFLPFYRSFNGYMEGWVRNAAPDLYSKVSPKWEAVKMMTASRIPRQETT